MNILGNNTSKLNEVIFENRNKSYGAYAIRQSYNDSLFKSLMCLSSMVILLFGSVYVYNKMDGASEIEKITLFDDPAIDPELYVTKVDITPPSEPVQNSAAAVAPAGTIGTTITDEEPLTTTPVNLENPISGTGSATATGVSATGTETSTVTTISIAATPEVEPSEIVVVADEMPEFEGGTAGLMRYVGQNVIYPSVAREIGIEGVVYVSFVVNETGNVEGAKVLRGIGHGCDEEVIRVISKMPRWKKAGKNAGHAVKVRYNIPVSFKFR
ncbi:MAG: energy transducer TonB [Bacteroidota bacterium]